MGGGGNGIILAGSIDGHRGAADWGRATNNLEAATALQPLSELRL